jgi:3-oxoacyl-(acyl-carrier-protein) synthase
LIDCLSLSFARRPTPSTANPSIPHLNTHTNTHTHTTNQPTNHTRTHPPTPTHATTPNQACGVLVDGPACHPFDEEGPHGFFRAEGIGCVVLRRLADAEAKGNRVLAKIPRALAASAGAADGSMEGAGRVYEQPCARGMREMFIRAYTTAGIPFRRLSYMECHATGTAVGDVIEIDVSTRGAQVGKAGPW